MKLDKYENKSKNKRKKLLISLGVIVLISISFLLYKTFASFTEEVEFPIMKGQVDYFGNSDVYFAFYKGNEKLNEMPKKDNSEGLVFIDGECDNGATIEWNNDEWSPLIKNLTKSKTKCTLYFNEKYIDRELNGADPVLGSNLIPIVINEENGTVTRASEKEKWYDYENQKWANAVILVNTPSKTYEVGEKIEEKDIRGYFVWIPKYSYRIFNMGNYEKSETTQPPSQVKEIEIVFGTANTSEKDGECKTPMESGLSRASDATKDCNVGDLMTHPAFLSIPSNGFWMGKFETGYNQNPDPNSSITDTSTWIAANALVNEEKPNNIIVKPNVSSWRGSTIYNYFMSEYNFNRNLDSHMTKNTEWGAVAYLSHSKYGIKNEVKINNNSNFLTGYAAKEKDAASSPTENTSWNTSNGYTASTTGNITGVYDMSGGAWEYVATYIQGQEEVSNLAEIVNNPLYTKYLDKYSPSSNDSSYKYRILGDATGEMGPFYNTRNVWYNDFANFTRINSPVFIRGGYSSDKVGAGQFSYHVVVGFDQNDHRNIDGARLTLTPTN